MKNRMWSTEKFQSIRHYFSKPSFVALSKQTRAENISSLQISSEICAFHFMAQTLQQIKKIRSTTVFPILL